MKQNLAILVVLLLVATTLAHICIYDPHQRGDLDISGPSGTCYRPKAPCGDQAVENPVVSWEAGSKQVIHFQQNLNHYSVGYPGYFDISYSPKVSDSQDDFKHLDFVRDVYYHRELHQHNFTYELSVPEEATSHGILQMRYISHKPGEPIFHQCFDVKIVPKRTKKSMNIAEKKVKKGDVSRLFALRYNPNEDMVTELIQLDESSNVWKTVTRFPGIVATSVAINNGLYSKRARVNHEMMKNNVNLAFIEDVFYFNEVDQSFNFLVSTNPSNPDHVPSTLFTYSLATGEQKTTSLSSVLAAIKSDFTQRSPDASDNDLSISMIRYHKFSDKLYIVSIVENKDGSYQWIVYSTDMNDVSFVAMGPANEKYFINFLWGTLYEDNANDRLTFIMRNEHDPFNMTQQLYTLPLKSESPVTMDTNTDHSFSCHHPIGEGNNIGMSVGTYNNYLPTPKVITNEVVLVNGLKKTGTLLGAIPEIKSYPYQGGCVQQGLVQQGLGYQVVHVYQRLSTKDRVLVRLNIRRENDISISMSNSDPTLPYMYNMLLVQ